MNDSWARVIGDWTAVGTAVATLAGWLPPIAGLFTIVWTGLQIYTWIENRGFIRGGRGKK